MMYGKDLTSSLLPTCIITNMILIQDDPGPGYFMIIVYSDIVYSDRND